jgi:hypothetical protein
MQGGRSVAVIELALHRRSLITEQGCHAGATGFEGHSSVKSDPRGRFVVAVNAGIDAPKSSRPLLDYGILSGKSFTVRHLDIERSVSDAICQILPV